MKISMTLFCVLMAFTLSAQYNNTYDINGNTNYLYPGMCIMTRDKGTISVSNGIDLPSPPRNDYFILTKLDAAGNVIFNKQYSSPATPSEGFVQMNALIETDDGGIIVAGGYIKPGIEGHPFAMKIDMAGNMVWSSIYTISGGRGFNKTSLCRVEDDLDENYFIVTSASSDKRPKDASTAVIKINNNGNLIWAKKYYDVNLPSSPFSSVQESPGDIAYSPINNLYMIAGLREEWMVSSRILNYFFGIDRDGNMLTQFKTMPVLGYPTGHDMIYDPNNNVFAVTFTHGNTGAFGPGVASGFGLVTIDAGLNIFLKKAYWHSAWTENDGKSISLCANGDYVIGGWMADNVLHSSSPTLLKVDNAGMPLWLSAYNVRSNAVTAYRPHCLAENPVTGQEQYVLICEKSNDLRVIRTDINGDVDNFFCPKESFTPSETDFSGAETLYDYYPEESGIEKPYIPSEILIPTPAIACNQSEARMAPNPAGVGSIAKDNGIQVYPSLVSASNARITVVNAYSTEVGMDVINSIGQLVYTNEHVSVGKSTISLKETGVLTGGIYFARIFDSNGNLIYTQKMIVID